MNLPTGYVLQRAPPSIETYRLLRVTCGMSPKSAEAAMLGLANTLFAVQVLSDDKPAGMGRVIGDGGCFYQVVDIAVLPTHQGKGLGKAIMQAIVDWLDENVPPSGYVSLIADGNAHHLYAGFGFVPTAPRSIGMSYLTRASRGQS